MRRDERTKEVFMRNMSLQSLIDMMTRESKREVFDKFRNSAPVLESVGGYIVFHTQRFSVAASFRKEGRQGWRFDRYNGLVLLSVGRLTGEDEAAMVKRLARMLPSTYAAFTGSSGKTVKILVRVARPDGTLPETETEALAFHRKAYNAAFCAYEGMVGFPITRVDPTLEQSFVRTYDPLPYANPEAVAMRIDKEMELTLSPASDVPSQPLQRMEPGEKSFAEMARRFVAIATRVAVKGGINSTEQAGEYLTMLARECCRAGYPLEEAKLHADIHFGNVARKEDIHIIFDSAYKLGALKFGTREAYNKTQRTALELRNFMRERYVLRHNVIQDTEEYRMNATWDPNYHLLDDRMMGKIVMDARMQGIDVWDKDVRRYIRSADTPSFNPVEDFLNAVRGTWDGTDRIGPLADTLPTHNPHWREWFRRWFLSMTAQWMDVMGQYGNSVAPLLIGRQGWRKSTFCRNLLPDELQFGYTDQLNFGSKQEIDRTICQYLLVNLDEFDQLTRQSQDGYLKNLLQRADIRARRLYKTQVSTIRRYASFIGTSNQRTLLTDPTGSRRYLCIELSGPIDTTSRPDYRQLYAQAVQLIEQGERYWFDDSDVEQIMENNRGNMRLETAEIVFHDLFAPARPEDSGAQWLTTTALIDEIRRHVGSRVAVSPAQFGRYLMALPGIESRRSNQGTKYCLKPLF